MNNVKHEGMNILENYVYSDTVRRLEHDEITQIIFSIGEIRKDDHNWRTTDEKLKFQLINNLTRRVGVLFAPKKHLRMGGIHNIKSLLQDDLQQIRTHYNGTSEK